MAIKKKVALYISSPEEANVLRERCAPIKPMLEIGLMKTFGAEPAADSFKKIHALMTNKDADLDWVIFHLPSVSQMIGSAVFLNELKKLIRAKAVEQTKTYIIDSGASMNSEGRAAFERFRVHIVDDESYIGDVFAKILDPNQLDIAAAAQEDPLFEGLIDDSPRLPGMRSDTPSKLNKSESDPFDDFDAALATEEEDPFAKSEAKKKAPDPFAAFNVTPAEMENNPFAGSSQSSPADPFSEFDFDDPPAPNPFAPAGPGAAIMADRADPFSSLDNPIPGGAADPFAAWNSSSTVSRNAGTLTAPDPNDPFAALRGQAGTPAPQADDLGNFGEFYDFSDPFADADLGNPEFVDQNHVSMPVVGGNNPSMPMNNNATAARGPAPVPQKSDELLFDDLGGVNDPNMGIEDDLSGGFDPFANIPENGFPQPVNGNGQVQRGFGAPPAMSSALAASARPPARATRPPAPTYNDEYYDDYGNGYDDYDDYDGYDDGYDDYNDRPPSRGDGGGMGLMTVEQLLEAYGDNLGDNDYLKMKSMMEPKWDYIMEKEDKIGAAGGFKLQIGKKGALKGISQVNSDDLANSVYIKEVEAEKGYYSPPNECKVITCYSNKGGVGKTTVSVMLATQLNWYFNPELMQNLTTSYTARILLLSLNEFDDIPTHGIGYDEYLSDENDNDGKNIVELVRRIDETNGEPSWDDISYCFVATRANKVFYLPSLTQREQITGNIVVTPQDYKKVIDVCSKFFSFVIMDSPDLFYHEKADIMNFAFSVSDIICFVIEPDTHSTTHLYHFFDGLRGDTNKFPLDSNKCICIVNKYVTSGNVYMPVEPIGQLKFEKIATSMSKYFARFVAIPFSQPRSYGNILDGTDPKVKYAAAELADDVLELIDYNDEVEEKKKQQRQRRR